MLKRCALLLLASALLAGMARPAGAGEFTLRSRTLLEGPTQAGAFTDEGFLLGAGGGVVLIHTLDDPDDRTFITIEGMPQEIAVFHEIAYIASGRGGLVVADFTDPSNPTASNRFSESRRAVGCALHERTLLLLDVENTVYTFDLSIPLDPLHVQTVRMKYIPILMATEGELVAVVGSRRGTVYTVQPDHTLRTCAKLDFSENTKRGVIHDRILYTVTLDGSIRRYDLADPHAPEEMPPLQFEKTIDIFFSGGEGAVLTTARKVIPLTPHDTARAGETQEHGHGRNGAPDGGGGFEIGKPLKIVGGEKVGEGSERGSLLSRIKNTLLYGTFPGRSVMLDGNRLALLAGRRGAFFFSIENGTARYLGHVTTPGFAVDLVASGGYLYVANASDGVRIGEVHDDGSVDWIGHLETVEARDLVVDGSVLALGDGKGGFKTIDVSDPRRPRLITTRSSPFFNSAIVCREQRAYIAGGLGGVEVLDYTDPADPRLVWRDEFSEVRGIHVDERYLYFSDGFDGFRIYSIAQDKPQPVATLNTEGWNCDCFVLGDYAYLADGGNGVKVVDVADREHPRLVGVAEIGSLTRNVHAVPGMVFAAVHTSGIAAVDVSDPANPFVAARHRTVDDGRGVWADDRFVYLASGSGGVYIFTYEP